MVKQNRRIISNSLLNNMTKSELMKYRNKRGNSNIYSEYYQDKDESITNKGGAL